MSGDAGWTAWAAQCSVEVARRANEVVQELACSAAQRDLLCTALSDLEHRLAQTTFSGSVHLPVLVAQGLGVPAPVALNLAARTALLDTGVHCLDDLADGDRPAYWGGYGSRERMLAAAMFLAAVPLTFDELGAPAATTLLLSRTLRQGMLQASDGQQAELTLPSGAAPSSTALEAIAAAKAGARRAAYATLAAQLAGAAPTLVSACARLGRATGTAAQLASDCADLFGSAESRDLQAGLCTYPIALALEQPGIDRALLLEALARARTDRQARDTVVAQLRAHHILRRCALTIAYHCQQAQQALSEVGIAAWERGGLSTLIDALSPLASAQGGHDECLRSAAAGA